MPSPRVTRRCPPQDNANAVADEAAGEHESDTPFVRTIFRMMMQRAVLMAIAVGLIHSLVFLGLGEPVWQATLIFTLACLPFHSLLSAQRPFGVFCASLFGFVCIIDAAVVYFALHFGREAGFHFLLISFFPFIAISGRIGYTMKWLLMLLHALLLVYLDKQISVQGMTTLSPYLISVLRAINLGVLACLLAGLVMHYFRIATGLQYELEQHASTDALTGLANRRRIQAATLEAASDSRRHGYPLSLLLFDLDHFKRINDSYGHASGDAVLRHIAQILQVELRSADRVGRWGGEEFLLLLPHTDLDSARLVAERIRQRVLNLPPLVGGKFLTLSATLGVATMLPAEPVEETLARADFALYEGKYAGRNRVVAAEATAPEQVPRH
ncbi:diguanylate cyclase (GGDEF)-like protein [Tahibacter aquaticus]|uniref:diguanylate cyclase n=2 Tax=Tahibacter aquaticus TaxID=520092 RepID=A0A4R6YVB9_9GAMM|nr:diguanylate cyclase (GGDEF)-like protein [Tahibacter aquaticus]